ncbi:MAG: arylesterase, partial [Gammaproteobacteria bacterium]
KTGVLLGKIGVRSFLFKCVILLHATVVSAAPNASQLESMLVLGDSLSAGYGISMNQAWPSLLQARLERLGHSIKVINASISGDTTKGGLSRIPRLLSKHNPELVMLELGANDGLRGIPADHAYQNLAAIIEKSVAAGATVLLFEMKIPPNYGPAFAAQYQKVYDDLAASDQVTLIPFFLADVIFKPAMMQNDGLHPTASAQPLLLEHVWPYVQSAIALPGAVGRVEPGLEINELTPY